MKTEKERQEFIAVLKHFSLFEPLSQYKVVCPFHADKNPSMLIDLDRCEFYCFGCQARGTTFDLVKLQYPSYNSFKIVQTIKSIVSGSVETKQAIIQIEPKKLDMAAVRDYYFNLPKVNWHKKGVDTEAKQYMQKRGFKMSTLNDAKAKINATDGYKIVFPIYDNGVFRGYVGRTTIKEIEEKRKYIYNTGFRRSKTLAGTYEGKAVLVVEGFLDMLKAKQCGVKNVVAILGWKMSLQQQNKLKRRKVQTIVCGLDNDSAGKKGYKYLCGLDCFTVVRLHYPKGVKDFGDVTQAIFDKRLKSQLIQYDLF